MSTEKTNENPKPPLADATGSAAPILTDADLAASYAQTAANFARQGWWVAAYVELHHAAAICWGHAEQERKQQNDKLSDGEQPSLSVGKHQKRERLLPVR